MNRKCAFDGCDRKHKAKGLCPGHWQQQRRGEELRPLQQRGRVRCEAGDGLGWSCIKPHYGNGLCNGHWKQCSRGLPLMPIAMPVTDATARSVMHTAGFSPSVPYPGNRKPWPGVCLKCGERGAPWYTSVRRGQGACQSCADWGIDYNKPAILYTVAGQPWIKCGIANTHRTKARLREHYNQGLVDVLHVIHLERGHDAKALEKLWKDHIDETIPKSDRPTKADLPDGYSEACRDHPDIRRWIESTLVPLAI